MNFYGFDGRSKNNYFLINKENAYYMACKFNEAGIPSIAFNWGSKYRIKTIRK